MSNLRQPLLYTEYAKYYDMIYKEYLEIRVPKLVDFIVKVFKEDSRRRVVDVLDIACGTGGPTIELARRGYKVLGVDISEQMIRIAREKAQDEGLPVKFGVCDMRNLNFKEEFDAATCLFTSISYNASKDDMLKTLRGVYKALRPGGVFIADNPNPFRSERAFQGIPYIRSIRRAETRMLIIDMVEAHPVTAKVHWNRTLVIDSPDGLKMAIDTHNLKFYTATELKLFAELAGFSEAKIYGDMRRAEPRDSRRLFLVAIK